MNTLGRSGARMVTRHRRGLFTLALLSGCTGGPASTGSGASDSGSEGDSNDGVTEGDNDDTGSGSEEGPGTTGTMSTAGTTTSASTTAGTTATTAGTTGATSLTTDPTSSGSDTTAATSTDAETTAGDTEGNGACDPGSSQTAWADDCSMDAQTNASCVAGTWSSWGSSSPENYPLRYETEHFAFLWPQERNVDMDAAVSAGAFLEEVVWETLLRDPVNFPEPDCERADKRKTSIHIIESGLFGGCNAGRPGIWVGAAALQDHWGLAHEFTHALQCMTPALPDCGAGGCWFFESHANWMSHQLEEYRETTHCADMLVDVPHLYYGSTRNRYCNWQFMEFLKDKHCYAAVNDIWGADDIPAGLADPLNKLAYNMGWSASELNDVFGEWAMHNITFDYRDPLTYGGADQGPTYRARWPIQDTSAPQRRRRLTQLEALDDDWANNRRFVSPYYWAPQRFGYNVIELATDPGAETVTVDFRGVVQDGADSDWRWGIVATDPAVTEPRYSELQAGTEGRLEFCKTSDDERLWLVVVATPTEIQKVIWDQPYPSIYRYPYMVQLGHAWPAGFEGGQRANCPEGFVRHDNGGGCAPPNLPASVYVGPYAQVLGGNVQGNARIEDHAIILDGATVSGGTVGALSTLSRFTVRDDARVMTTFYPPGFFEPNQSLSGTATLYGDVEHRGAELDRSSGSFFGFVDANTGSSSIDEVTVPPPYAWRP